MAKNIAIIIGISEYSNVAFLKGCKIDADSIRSLIDATGKYDDVLQLDCRVEASEINDKLPSFIKKYKSEKIDEVFFYYSGHGCVINDGFAYVASDFDYSKPNTTTISNDIVDDLLKSLNANVVVKIIDACRSGTQYVKDIEMIPKYINRHKDEFANCYFMFSSRNDQNSIATPSLSVFTRSFIQAVKTCNNGDIKYINIANCIADDFMSISDQKPQFVHQADLTEVFCVKDDRLNNILDSLLAGNPSRSKTKPTDIDSPLLSAIKIESQSYKTEEQIYEILENVKTVLTGIELRKEISELYECTRSFDDKFSGFNQKKEIGEWLSKSKHNYFAKVERSSYGLSDMYFSQSPLGLKEKDKPYNANFMDEFLGINNTYISGFSHHIKYPYVQISCLYKPKYPNLSGFKIKMAFVCSNIELALFSYTTEMKDGKELYFYSNITPLLVNTIKFVDGEIDRVFIEQIKKGEDAMIAKLKNQYLKMPDSSIG